MLVRGMLTAALGGDVGAACRSLAQLQRLGYSAEDVLGVVLRVARALDAAEGARLALLREAARAPARRGRARVTAAAGRHAGAHVPRRHRQRRQRRRLVRARV